MNILLIIVVIITTYITYQYYTEKKDQEKNAIKRNQEAQKLQNIVKNKLDEIYHYYEVLQYDKAMEAIDQYDKIDKFAVVNDLDGKFKDIVLRCFYHKAFSTNSMFDIIKLYDEWYNKYYSFQLFTPHNDIRVINEAYDYDLKKSYTIIEKNAQRMGVWNMF